MIYVWRKLSRKNHAFIKVIDFVNHDDMTCLKKLKYLCNFNPSYLVIVGQLFILIIVSQQAFRLEMRQKYFHINTNFNLVISNYIPCLLKYNQNVNSRFNHCFCSIIDKSKSPGVQTVAASTPLRWKSKLHLIAKTTIVSKSKRIYIHTHSFSPIFKIILIILRI